MGLVYWTVYAGPTFAVTEVEVVGVEPALIKTITDPLMGSNIWRVNAIAIEENSKQVYNPIEKVSVVQCRS